MTIRRSLFATASLAIVAMLGFASPAPAADVTSDSVLNADKTPGDWLTYHGSYKGWHFSGLDQINTGNVDKLRIAWIHQPGRSTRGVRRIVIGGATHAVRGAKRAARRIERFRCACQERLAPEGLACRRTRQEHRQRGRVEQVERRGGRGWRSADRGGNHRRIESRGP